MSEGSLLTPTEPTAPTNPNPHQPGDGNNPQPAANPPAGLLNPDGSFAEGWLDRLPENLAEAKPTLQKFKSFNDLASSYVSLQKMLGKKGVTVPGENATPEEVAAFRKALGVPESPEGYQLKPEQLPEGLTWDDELAKGFAEIAHKHNIPAAAMKELAERFVASEAAKLELMAQAAQAELEQGRAELQKEYGGAFKERIQLATRVANMVGLDPESPGLRDPNVVRALVRIGNLLSEDRIAQLGNALQTGGMSSKDIMTNPQNPYYERYRKGDPEAVQLVRDLLSQGR